jgi:hypothetical protein
MIWDRFLAQPSLGQREARSGIRCSEIGANVLSQ